MLTHTVSIIRDKILVPKVGTISVATRNMRTRLDQGYLEIYLYLKMAVPRPPGVKRR